MEKLQYKKIKGDDKNAVVKKANRKMKKDLLIELVFMRIS